MNMNKNIIITILLAVVAMTGQAQVKSGLDLCLRDEATGKSIRHRYWQQSACLITRQKMKRHGQVAFKPKREILRCVFVYARQRRKQNSIIQPVRTYPAVSAPITWTIYKICLPILCSAIVGWRTTRKNNRPCWIKQRPNWIHCNGCARRYHWCAAMVSK